MELPHDYHIQLIWTGARTGELLSPDIDSLNPGPNGGLSVATPHPFQGGIGGTWSPEHLYTAAVASCLMTTFLAIAANSNLEFSEFKCHAIGRLEQPEGKFKMTEVHLHPVVSIAVEAHREKVMRILEKSEKACLITHSVNARVIMQPEVLMV